MVPKFSVYAWMKRPADNEEGWRYIYEGTSFFKAVYGVVLCRIKGFGVRGEWN